MLQYLDKHVAPTGLTVGDVVLKNVSRRSFLKGTALGTGFVVAMYTLPFREAGAFTRYPTGGLDMPHGIVEDPHVFISIDPDGTVTMVAIRSEMGTGSRTSIPMVMADELEADWSRVKIVQAPGDEPKYGNQDTDGSRSMRHHIQPARYMGGAVRTMLERAAAAQWGVEPKLCRARNHEVVLLDKETMGEGVVTKETDQVLGYGDLAEAAMQLPVPTHDEIVYKTEDQFRYIGKGEVQIYDLRDITTGQAIYGADVYLPGMKFAAIARPPVVGGKVRSVDSAAALAVPGVEQVVEMEGHTPPAKFLPLGGVAVIASNTHAALKGRDALVIEWDDGPNAVYNTPKYRAAMEETAAQAWQGDPRSGQRRYRFGGCVQGLCGGILPAAHGAHSDGADGGACQRCRWQVRDLGAGPESLRHANGRGRVHRAPGRGRYRQRHASGWRIRAKVQV